MIKKGLVLIWIGGLAFAGTIALADHNAAHKVQEAGKPTLTRVATGEDETFVESEDWATIPGASVRVRVPEGGKALIMARFTSEAVCFAPTIDHCAMRIQVGTKSAHPASGKDFHIDSRYAGEGQESQKGRAFDRALTVGPGTYRVQVQGAAMGGMVLRVDDWSLTVKRAPV